MITVTGFTDLTAEAHRNQTAAFLATTGPLDNWNTPTGITVRPGVHSGFGWTKTGPLTGEIAIGRAIIQGANSPDGAYVVTMDEPEPFEFEPGDGVYNRRDLVCLQIDDLPEPPAEGEPEPPAVAGASIVVVKGVGVTGTTTPAIPATPPNAIPLWAFGIGAGMNETNGGFSPTGNIFEMRKRLMLANQDRQPFAMAAGQVSITVAKNAIYAFKAITFPTGRFRTTPIVTATLSSAPGGSQKLSARSYGRTPTGASIYVYTGDQAAADTSGSVTVTVDWTAIQMTEDTAAG